MNAPQHQIIEITKPHNTGRHVIGILGENTTSSTTAALNRMKSEGERYLRAAYDIRTNRNFGSFERGERLKESSSGLLKEANGIAKEIARSREKLKSDMYAFNPVKGYSHAAPWQPEFDLRMVDAFKALPLHQQSAIKHQIADRETTFMHLNWVEAFVRLPVELSPLDFNERLQATINIGRLLAPEELGSIERRMKEQDLLTSMLRTSLQLVGDEIGSLSPIIDGARDAWDLTREKAPSWPFQEVAAKQAPELQTPTQPTPEPAPEPALAE
jgi:hypothetical protein